jgi:hypothetical protein
LGNRSGKVIDTYKGIEGDRSPHVKTLDYDREEESNPETRLLPYDNQDILDLAPD